MKPGESKTAPEILQCSDKPALDLPTSLLLLLMVGGQFFLASAIFQNKIDLLSALILSILLMNLSFTIWHECAHRNFSRFDLLADFCGALASFFALGPAYFHRRNEHIIHHRHEGDPEKDPVYPRIQVKLMDFPLHLISLRRAGKNQVKFTELMPLNSRERLIDLALTFLTILLVALAVALGLGKELLFVWILPRIAITFAHAYYICFLPHHLNEGGFAKYRAMPGAFIQFFTVNQSLHGVHHMYPFRPWHQYPRMLEAIQASERGNDLEVK